MDVRVVVAGAAILIVLAFWWEYTLWEECRKINSWSYCLRVLSK